MKSKKGLIVRGLLICLTILFIVLTLNIYGDSKIEINNLSNFNSINLKLSYKTKIELIQSQTFNVIIKGKKEDIESIDTKVKNNTLIFENFTSFFDFFKINNEEIEIIIKMPMLLSLEANGVNDIKFENKWVQNNNINLILNGGNKLEGEIESSGIDLFVNGSGKVDIKVVNSITKIDISGSGKIEIEGDTKLLKISLSGSSNVDCSEIKANNGILTINGSGEIKSKITEQIKVTINGSGNVINIGNPKAEVSTSGSGSFITK